MAALTVYVGFSGPARAVEPRVFLRTCHTVFCSTNCVCVLPWTLVLRSQLVGQRHSIFASTTGAMDEQVLK